jgi:hypothetical protein
LSIEHSPRSTVGKLVPSTNRKVDIIIAATRASIGDRHNHLVSIVEILDFDPPSAVRARGFIFHPIIAEGCNDCRVRVLVAARSNTTLLGIDGASAVVAKRLVRLKNNENDTK